MSCYYEPLSLLDKIKYYIKKFYDPRYRKLGTKYRKDPIDIWAFIRAKNEIKTIETSLNSIIPAIQHGVIGYNKLPDEQDDGTEEFILNFCQKHNGFIPFRYEYKVYPSGAKEYQNLQDIPEENTLAAYYSAVLKKIPQDVWMMKIDCDHVFDTEKLEQLRYLPKTDQDIIILSTLDFHYQNNKAYVLRNTRHNKLCFRSCGEWLLLKNKDIVFKMKVGHDNKINYDYAYEEMTHTNKSIFSRHSIYRTDLFNWHFPYLKSSRESQQFTLVPLDNHDISKEELESLKIPAKFLDNQTVIEICKKFNIKKSRHT